MDSCRLQIDLLLLHRQCPSSPSGPSSSSAARSSRARDGVHPWQLMAAPSPWKTGTPRHLFWPRESSGGALDGAARRPCCPWRRPGRTPSEDGTSSTVRGWTVNEIPPTPGHIPSVGSGMCGRGGWGAKQALAGFLALARTQHAVAGRAACRRPLRRNPARSSPQPAPVWALNRCTSFSDEGRRGVAAKAAASGSREQHAGAGTCDQAAALDHPRVSCHR